MRSRTIIVATMFAIGLIFPGPVATQDMTPAAEGVVTPDPAQCTVEPRSMESLLDISGSPPPMRTPVSISTPGLQVPEGHPADRETASAVTDMILELIACQNAGDFPRTSAFYTDNVLWTFESQQPMPAEQKIATFGGTPVPLPPEQAIAVRVVEVSVLPDGEMIAVVERHLPIGVATIVYVIVQQDGQYLIDHAMDDHFEPSATPPA